MFLGRAPLDARPRARLGDRLHWDAPILLFLRRCTRVSCNILGVSCGPVTAPPRPRDPHTTVLGIVGGGQLARMTALDAARLGVDVRVLTNSYASTDVGAVHAGYAKHRNLLIQAGVQLFEVPAPDDEPKTVRKFVRTGSREQDGTPGSTLHAKAFSVDGTRLFVGSLNFDPRSFSLNTELGIVIDNAALAKQMRQAFDDTIARNTYRVVLDDDELGWIDARDDEPVIERIEPGTTFLSRMLVRVLERFPIDWLL